MTGDTSDEYEIVSSLRTATFFLERMLEGKQLTNSKALRIEAALAYLLVLSKKCKESLLESNCEWILTSPILYKQASWIVESDGNDQAQIAANVIVRVVLLMNETLVKKTLLLPYKRKLMAQLDLTLKANKNLSKQLLTMDLMDSLKLDLTELNQMLSSVAMSTTKKLVEASGKELSLRGHLIGDLLEMIDLRCQAVDDSYSMDKRLFRRILLHLVTLKSHEEINFAGWEYSLYRLLLRFPHLTTDVDKSASF